MSGFFMSMMGGQGLPGFTYKRAISVDNTGSNENKTNCQIKVILNTSNFSFSNAKTNGEDIRFTQGGQILNHWIESYSPTSAVIWVKLQDGTLASVIPLNIHYGNVGAVTTSNFPSTMLRVSSNVNTTLLAPFNEGAGSTASTMTINGSTTWNSNDLFGGTSKSLTLNGSGGYVSKTGLLDTYPTKGHIKIRFKINSLSANNCLFFKQNRNGTTGSDYGDFIRVYYTSSGTCYLSVYNGAGLQKQVTCLTTLQLNTTYELSVTWNETMTYIYINGKYEGQLIGRVNNGSANPFLIGVLQDISGATLSAWSANITVNDFLVENIQPILPEIKAIHDSRKYYEKDEESKWKKSLVYLAGGLDPNFNDEPNIIFNGTHYQMWCKWTASAGVGAVGYKQATTINGLVAASLQRVIGGGFGGVSESVTQPFVMKENGVYYLFFAFDVTGTAGSKIDVMTSTDGITFSNRTTAFAVAGSGWGSAGYYNISVTKDGSEYIMIAEAYDASLRYILGVAKSNSVSGPYTAFGTNPKLSLQYATGGNCGGSWMKKIGNVYHAWYHACETTVVLPHEIYRSYSTDLNNWTHAYPEPINRIDEATSIDQTADPYLFEENNESYLFYSSNDNRAAYIGNITYSKFSGTLDQIVKDLTISIGSEQVL